jgi:pimeloyl-ACP methyl ester carboxylesterase
MSKRVLRDGTGAFDVTVLEAAEPSRVVLFAVGGGGNPERHLPLLTSLAALGCAVVAPHFERLGAPTPTESELLLRARRLSLALDSVVRPGLPVAGVGHSIGATMLLALAGGQVWMRAGQRLSLAPDARLDRLVLFAPATGFFQAPAALDAVRTPIRAWAGTKDVITPLAQAKFLKQALEPRVQVEVRVVEGTGHFSFMNEPPPHMTDPLPNRDAFPTDLADSVGRFVTS